MTGFARRLQASVGEITTLPSGFAKPDSTNTGPRYSLTQTLTAAEAMSIMSSTGYLNRAHITGGIIDMESGWVLEDCLIDGNPLYNIRSFHSTSLAPPAVNPIIRYCEISGGDNTVSCLGIQYTTVEYCDVWSGIDLFKVGSGSIVRHCYAHDLYGIEGGHCDVVQVRHGEDMLFEWNNMIAIKTLGFNAGNPENGNGVLQTGSFDGDIRHMYWYDNWVDGGGHTLRAADPADIGAFQQEDIIFRRNKHGRAFTFSPASNMYAPGTPGAVAWYYPDNVWEDDGTTVNP